jgi:putative protease
MERKKIGEVFHFFGKIGVAAIRLTDGSLAVGDNVQIQGPTTNLEQTVDALQIEHAAVSSADPGQEVGMKVRDRVREKDFVYKLIPTAEPRTPSTAPRAPAAPRTSVATRAPAAKRSPAATRPARRAARPKPRRKAPRKKAPAGKKATAKRAKPARRKATRATRSKARRGSRGSRRRSR